MGSPPQVRGKHYSAVHLHISIRITPAGAGKTCTEENADTGGQDHPRRCGENTKLRSCIFDDTGSPPQVRGKPKENACERKVCGITPAGAGKTTQARSNNGFFKDHPRRCGENGNRSTCPTVKMGSPPQVRGKLTHNHRRDRQIRITPAGAGKTRGRIVV